MNFPTSGDTWRKNFHQYRTVKKKCATEGCENVIEGSPRRKYCDSCRARARKRAQQRYYKRTRKGKRRGATIDRRRANLTEDQIANIQAQTGDVVAALAREYDVSPRTIKRIQSGTSQGHKR